MVSVVVVCCFRVYLLLVFAVFVCVAFALFLRVRLLCGRSLCLLCWCLSICSFGNHAFPKRRRKLIQEAIEAEVPKTREIKADVGRQVDGIKKGGVTPADPGVKFYTGPQAGDKKFCPAEHIPVLETGSKAYPDQVARTNVAVPIGVVEV